MKFEQFYCINLLRKTNKQYYENCQEWNGQPNLQDIAKAMNNFFHQYYQKFKFKTTQGIISD